ncbi:MAG: putative quinol monooxygenase [Ilumatobacteraceae bacterium]
MATILAHIVIVEGKQAEFEAIAASLFEASHATEGRLRAYGYWRGQEPRSYYTLLAFDDYLGFLAHQTSAHHEAASPHLGECIESMSLEWVDPVEGASGLVRSDPQDLPLDASPLMVRYAERLPPRVADWWRPLRAARSGRASETAEPSVVDEGR